MESGRTRSGTLRLSLAGFTVSDRPSMRQKWLDVVATIRLAECEHDTCMFIAAPRPVGFTAQPTGCEHETGLPPWFACDRQADGRQSAASDGGRAAVRQSRGHRSGTDDLRVRRSRILGTGA